MERHSRGTGDSRSLCPSKREQISMQTVDLREDANTFRQELEAAIESIVASKPSCLSAIEIGYSCDQSGWIFIHPDERPAHQRDGEWTTSIEDEKLIKYDHWIEAIEASFEGKAFTVIKYDGSKFEVAFDEDEPEQDSEDPFVKAVGEMILEVLRAAKVDGVFSQLKPFGSVQLDIEDFNGGWGWPEYDDLGKTNFA